jgi:putative ABC transport system permease protein
MTPGSRFRSWLLAVLGRTRMESEMDAELRFHIEAFAEDLVRSGLPRREALRRARIEFGGIERAKEECREARGVNFLETLFQDLRFGQRMLRKAPGFTLVAVLTLALGIGANAAIFSYIDAWFIKPLPYPQSDRLVIFETQDKKHGWTSGGVTSAADFFDFQKQNTLFEQTVAWGGASLNLTGDGLPELIDGGRVSWNFFDTLGAKPILGRTFTADDDRSGAPHVAILSQGLWQGRYAGDPKIIGRNIAIGGEAYTVVGVMPGTFQFPLMGIANLWTPLALTDMQLADRGNVWLPAFGRLKPGITLEQAREETATFFAHLEKEFPKTNTNLTWLVSSMTVRIRKEEGGPEVMICFVVVALVLLIACANVANLMLARATSRTKEFAVRGALGATRRRLAGQLLTESLLLFLVGGAASLVFASWGMRWIESQTPGHIRGYIVNYGHVELDFSMLMFTLGITLLCGLVFGFAPAFENSRLDVNHTLKETSGQTSGSKRGARLRRIFVAAEIALAVVVLISATLLVKSFLISVRSSPGYNPANILVAQLALPKTKYTEDSQLRNFSDEVLSRIRALPGGASTSVASHVPFGGFGQGIEFQVVGKPLQPGERHGAPFTAVSADYFSTMQIGLVKGRFFDSSDAYGTSPSIIISQTMARELLPGEDPIGKKLGLGEQHSVGTIVGIVNDIKMNYLRERPGWHIYAPLAQFPSRTFGFVVRSSGDPTIMATAIRDAIWAVDRDQPISSVEPLENLIAVVNTGDRLVADLMVFFSVLAMFLGAIGIYGVMAHLVSQRIHEIGIRMALGASPVDVMSMVLSQGLKLALGGVGAGVLAALGATRLLATQLYEVTPTDPLTFIGVPLLFAIVALAACYVPAWRGMRVDPLVALRYE